MERKSLNEILERSSRGMAISRGYVEKQVRLFIYGRLENAFPRDWYEGDVKESADELRKQFGVFNPESSFIDTIRGHYRIMRDSDKWEMEDFYGLCMIVCSKHNSNPFFNLSVEDYLRMAGMDEEYEQFFFREDMEWRKNGRRALRIYEIGYKCMEVMVNEPERKWQKKDVWQGTERMYICRVLKQIWFLLAEAPMRWDTILRRRMMDRPPGLV